MQIWASSAAARAPQARRRLMAGHASPKRTLAPIPAGADAHCSDWVREGRPSCAGGPLTTTGTGAAPVTAHGLFLVECGIPLFGWAVLVQRPGYAIKASIQPAKYC